MKKKKHIILKVLLVLVVIGLVRGAFGRTCTSGSRTAATTQPVTKTTATEAATPKAAASETKTAPAAETTPVKTAVTEAVVGKDFKKAMDTYEAFFDEYCTFMKKYAKNPTDLNLMLEYTSYLAKYTEFMEAMEKMEDTPMNDAETAYYLEVTLRIEKKLLEAEGALLGSVK